MSSASVLGGRVVRGRGVVVSACVCAASFVVVGPTAMGSPTAEEMAALRERIAGVLPEVGCIQATFDVPESMRAEGFFGERRVIFDLKSGACAEIGPRGYVVVSADGTKYRGTSVVGSVEEVEQPPNPGAWQSALLVGVYVPAAYVRAMMVEPSYISKITTREDGVMLVRIGEDSESSRPVPMILQERLMREQQGGQGSSSGPSVKSAVPQEPVVCVVGEPVPIDRAKLNRVRPFTVHLDVRGMPILIDTEMTTFEITYSDPERGLLQPVAGWASKVVVSSDISESGCESGLFEFGRIETICGEMLARHVDALAKFRQRRVH